MQNPTGGLARDILHPAQGVYTVFCLSCGDARNGSSIAIYFSVAKKLLADSNKCKNCVFILLFSRLALTFEKSGGGSEEQIGKVRAR